jgi:hypothetical protein
VGAGAAVASVQSSTSALPVRKSRLASFGEMARQQ